MAGKSTISITLKLEGDDKTFKELTTDAEGLRKLFQSTIGPAENLKKSLINWSAGAQAIDAVTSSIERMSSAYSRFSDRMKGVQDANIRITQLTGKTGDEMRKLRSSVQAVSEHFGADFNETLQAANALSKGFGISIDDAMKLLRDGLVSGADANGDFIDTLREYPRYFKEAGLSAEDFVAIATNAAQQGVFSDKGVDVIKEGNLRIREMTTATAAALEGIGISAEEVQAGLRSGALTTFEAMQMVAAKLNELPASSSAVGTAIADIFGGPGEDAGLEYIKTLANIELNMDAVKAATQGTAEQQERQIQMQEKMKNTLSSIIDLSSIYTDIKPWADLTAQVGMAAMGLGGLVKTVRVATKNFKASALMTRLFGQGSAFAAVRTRMLAGTMATGAASATAFSVAMRGLMIATGVGAVFVALSGIIGLLSGKSEEAAVNLEDLKEAEDEFTRVAADVKVEIDGEIKKLGQLIEAKQDTTEAVKQLNDKYGEAFGTYQTAAGWYDVLTKKSGTYARMVGYEAQARMLATKITEREIALEQNKRRQEELRKSGRATEVKTVIRSAGNETGFYAERITVETKEMSEYTKAAGVLTKELESLKEQQKIAEDEILKLGKEMDASVRSTTGQTAAIKVNAMTWQQVSDAISETEKKLKNTTDEKKIAELKAYNAQLLQRKQLLEEMTGLGGGKVAGEGVGSKAPQGLNEAATKLGEIESNIQVLRKQLQEASVEEAASINQQIAAWNEKADAIRSAGKAVEESEPEGERLKVDANASTLQGFEENIRALNEELQTADMGRAAELNREIALWNEKAEAIRNAGKEAEKTSVSTGKALLEGWNGIKGIGSSIEGMTDALKGNGNAWQAVTGIVDGFIGLYQSFERIVQIINALTGVTNMLAAAKQGEAEATTQAANAAVAGMAQEMAASAAAAATKTAETNANVSAAASGALAAHAGIPFVGIALGLAAVASIIAAMASLPKFAKGGIVSGPTLAMVGEYAGASGNPEVIAPLDKLRGMLKEPAGVDFGRVEFEIKGRTLVGILNKENNITKRS